LVELVVVVAILSTLASLLGPSLNQVVDDSRTLSCQKHLKAIGVNLFLYADDHTFFPSSYKDLSASPKIYVSYSDHLAPYDGRGQLPQNIFEKHNWYDKKSGPWFRTSAYTCPQETELNVETNSAGIVSVFNRTNYFPNSHYKATNENRSPLGFTGTDLLDDWSQTPEFYPDPQSTLALVEKSGKANRSNAIGNALEIPYPYHQSELDSNGVPFRSIEPDRDRWHNNGWNYLFIDGHVKNLLPEETVGPGRTMGDQARGFWSYTPGD
jgi:prepilin-type processing-associated H-X9-DG protein